MKVQSPATDGPKCPKNQESLNWFVQTPALQRRSSALTHMSATASSCCTPVHRGANRNPANRTRKLGNHVRLGYNAPDTFDVGRRLRTFGRKHAQTIGSRRCENEAVGYGGRDRN